MDLPSARREAIRQLAEVRLRLEAAERELAETGPSCKRLRPGSVR
jgi:hypothetical protein